MRNYVSTEVHLMLPDYAFLVGLVNRVSVVPQLQDDCDAERNASMRLCCRLDTFICADKYSNLKNVVQF